MTFKNPSISSYLFTLLLLALLAPSSAHAESADPAPSSIGPTRLPGVDPWRPLILPERKAPQPPGEFTGGVEEPPQPPPLRPTAFTYFAVAEDRGRRVAVLDVGGVAHVVTVGQTIKDGDRALLDILDIEIDGVRVFDHAISRAVRRPLID